MDLVKSIATFMHVVELGSFSETARRLDIAVSAVSRQVSELEQHVDCKLLYRTTRVMKLTSEGEFFVEKFRFILQQVEALDSSIVEKNEKVAGKLRITSPQNIGHMGINGKIISFLKKYPAVDLSWMMVNRYVDLIKEGFDLAIRSGPLEDSSFVSRRYGSFSMQYAASQEYLHTWGEPKHPIELRKHNCLLDSSLPTPGKLRYQEKGVEKQVNVSGNVSLNQGYLLVEYAVAGIGICYLPDFLLEEKLRNNTLIPVLEEYWLPAKNLYFIYPAPKLSNPLIKAFIDHLFDGS